MKFVTETNFNLQNVHTY